MEKARELTPEQMEKATGGSIDKWFRCPYCFRMHRADEPCTARREDGPEPSPAPAPVPAPSQQ